MMFDVTEIEEGQHVLQVFPALQTFPEFKEQFEEIADEQIDHDMLLKYIFLLYDHESPLRQHDNLIKRKLEAAQIAGFQVDEKGFFEPEVDAAMKGFNKNVNAMIIRFCRMQGSSTYSALVTVNEAYYYKLQLVLSAPSDHKNKSEIELERVKGQLWQQSKEMMVDIAQLTKDLLNEDNSPYLKKDLFCVIDKESQELLLTPEKMAQRGKVEV